MKDGEGKKRLAWQRQLLNKPGILGCRSEVWHRGDHRQGAARMGAGKKRLTLQGCLRNKWSTWVWPRARLAIVLIVVGIRERQQREGVTHSAKGCYK